MSRSRRKSPIRGITTAPSEAYDKAQWHRALRHAEKQRLSTAPDSEPCHPREFSDPWTMRKDGKRWQSAADRSVRWMCK